MKQFSFFNELCKKICRRLYFYWLSFCAGIDYLRYSLSLFSFRRIARNLPDSNKGSLLIVSGRGMNVVWAQVWTVLSLAIRIRGYRGLVLTNHTNKHINRYYKLLGLELIYYDDVAEKFPFSLPPELAQKVNQAASFNDYRNIEYKGTLLGDIALSTYSRYHGTGLIDLNDKDVVKYIKEWIICLVRAIEVAEYLYTQHHVEHLFFTEFFAEEYGAFYTVALRRKLNIVKFTGTIRDDAFLLHHPTEATDRIHHASLLPSTWERIKIMPFSSKMDQDLVKNFSDRYGNKWHRSLRNHGNTRIMPVEEAKRLLKVPEHRKIAVIYSHILYDNLFIFGTDLFNDYAEWFVETVRIACQNPEVEWFVKVHPSNMWRGELNTLLKGRYEEEKLISRKIGELPTHVHIVSADNGINPYTWFQLADYGVTVRGTSGLEMAALGKTVITSGTGRYEGKGFTIDPRNKSEYLAILKSLPNVASMSSAQIELAKRYAYGLFVLKPFTFTSFLPRFRTGAKRIIASDDFVYIPKSFDGLLLPLDIQKFSEWAFARGRLEFLSDPDRV